MAFSTPTLAALAVFFFAFTLAQDLTPTTPPSCSAVITVNTSYPSHAFYLYNDIIVENTGLCDITQVFVNIALPPGQDAFEYINITQATGELTGFSLPFSQENVQRGGTIVLNSARIPYVTLASVVCSTTCNTPSGPKDPTSIPTSAPTAPTRTPTLELAVRAGVSPSWFAFNVLANDTTVDMSKVEIRDIGAYTTWQPMTAYPLNGLPIFTFSPTSGPLTLPISVRMTTASTTPLMVVVMRDFITSYADGAIDTEVAYPPSTLA